MFRSSIFLARFNNATENTVILQAPNISTLSVNPTKWPNTLKQFVGKLPTNCLRVFDHFVKLALKGLGEIKGINFYSPSNCRKTRGDDFRKNEVNQFVQICLTFS